ncbi:MAG: Hvo_1808 family surface protein [Halolamina sp.]
MFRAPLVVAVVLVVAGCAAPLGPPTAKPVVDNPDGRADPAGDPLGWEAGYWADDPLAVDQSDGLNATERRAFVARTMARVERVRGLEFKSYVPVEVVSREAFADRSDNDPSAARSAWNNQRWEAALLVGESRNTTELFDELYGGTVLGYYSPGEDAIVVVSDGETPTIDRTTLAHELLHALQDQHFGLAGGGRTNDAGLAHDGLVEGDASYTETLYEERCEGGEWSCVPRPSDGAAGSLPNGSLGLYVSIFTPYAEGPNLVHRVRQRGGWEAVNAMYDDRPTTTEQLVHPDAYPEEGAATVTVPDRSASSWSRFDLRRSTDRLGEATLFAMFWYQRTVPREALREDVDPYDAYDYAANASDGWAGDRLVPYRNGNRTGYVWRLRWENASEAAAFADAYRRTLLLRLLAEEVRPGVYRVEDGPFADAFRVTVEGDTVTVVNAPTVDELDAVHGPS